MADPKFKVLAEEYFQASYRASPTTATQLGIHQYDHLLDDASAPALRVRAVELKDLRERFIGLGSTGDGNSETDRTLIQAEIDTELLSLESIRDWERDPSYYVSEPLFSVFLLMSRDFAPMHNRIQSVAARLEQLPDVLASGRANLKNPPRVLTEIAIEETEGAIEFCSTLIAQLSRQVPKPPRQLVRAASRASRALYEYLDFLREELLLVSTGRLGIGEENFVAKLRYEHMLSYSLEEIVSMGQQVFDETLLELVEWAGRIDPNSTWREITEEARKQYPSKTQLLQTYRKEIARLKHFILEHDLVTMPEEECEVIETPAFDRALNSTAAYVAPGPFEAGQTGQFWVTPADPTAPQAAQTEHLEGHNNFVYPITSLHEAYPGHHVQMMRANQTGSRWRRHFSSSIFAEGWALYCEELMGEVGYYSDPRVKLFQLRERLWRAARVILEIGMHCYELAPEDAARFLVNQVGMTHTEARSETRRYAAEPTQPLSYLMGQLEVFKLRKEFSSLGLREFHDLLLSSGTIPFALVEKEMHASLQGHVSEEK